MQSGESRLITRETSSIKNLILSQTIFWCCGRSLLAISVASLLLSQPALGRPQENQSGAVFALIDSNEWCPGGSVYLDLKTGSFLLFPRLSRPSCADSSSNVAVERGTLPPLVLNRLRPILAEARRAGLQRDRCDVVVSNGGPETLAITTPGFSDKTPDELGCWSEEATALHREIFGIFGKKRAAARSARR